MKYYSVEQLERAAMNGNELPDKLSQPDQLLYLQFRSLYREFRAGAISKEQAAAEKRKLVEEHGRETFLHGIYANTAKMRVYVGSLLVEVDRNGCELCRKVARVFDGREKPATDEKKGCVE